MTSRAETDKAENISDLFKDDPTLKIGEFELDPDGKTASEELPVFKSEIYTLANGITDCIGKTLMSQSQVDYLIKIIYHIHKNLTVTSIMSLPAFKAICYYLMAMPCFIYESRNGNAVSYSMGSFLLGIVATQAGVVETTTKESLIESIIGLHYFLVHSKVQYQNAAIDAFMVQRALADIFATETLNIVLKVREDMLATSITPYSVTFKMTDVFIQWMADKDDKKAVEHYDLIFKDILQPVFRIRLGGKINK